MQAEEFTAKLQKELNSAPQPYLVPFLKVSVIFLAFSSFNLVGKYKQLLSIQIYLFCCKIV